MSVLYVGAYAWSFSNNISDTASSLSGAGGSSMCGATSASGVSVHVSSSACSNCSALSTSRATSFGANSYGGSIGIYIGSVSYSFAAGEFRFLSTSLVEATRVQCLSVTLKNSTIVDTEALIGEYCTILPIQSLQTKMALCLRNWRDLVWRQREILLRVSFDVLAMM